MDTNKEIKIDNLTIFKVNDYSAKAKKEYSYLSLRYTDSKGELKEFKRVFMDDKEITLLEFIEL